MKPFALGVVIGVGFLVIILVAIRRRALRDQMAILWLSVSVVMLVLGISLPFHLLDHLGHAVGIRYGSDLVFGAAVVFLVLLVLQLSVAVARLQAQTTRLAQELGILRIAHSQPAAFDLDRPSGREPELLDRSPGRASVSGGPPRQGATR